MNAGPAGDRPSQELFGLIQRNLDALSHALEPSQWSLLDTVSGSVLQCAGDGPLGMHRTVPGPFSMAPRQCEGGWLTTELLSVSDHAGGYGLACWVPEKKGPLDEALLALLDNQARLVETILDQAHRHETLLRELADARREADCDILTGLHNRRGWSRITETEEARSRRYQHSCTLVVVDLDELKQINDTRGHRAGDQLIRQAARVIHSTTRQPDRVARVGGDEFAILLVETDYERARGFLARLDAALSAAGVRASMGCAEWNPDETLCDTLYRADQAMYNDKRARHQARVG